MTNQVNRLAVTLPDPATTDGQADAWRIIELDDTDLWEWRISVGGVNVTTVNGQRTEPQSPLKFEEPYGETTLALNVPGVTRWLLGTSGYEWCATGKSVRITKHSLVDGTEVGSIGAWVVYDIDVSGGSAGGGVSLMCAGALSGPAGVTHYKPGLSATTGTDIGDLIEDALDFPSKRHTFTTATVSDTWDDPDAEFGYGAATVLNRVDRLLVEAYPGKWTVARTSTAADYELATKDTSTVDATIALGAPGVRERLRQSLGDSPNVIYGTYDATTLAADSALRTAPLAYDEKCDPNLYSSTTGAVTGANPDYDADVPRVERFVNVGNRITRARAERLAGRLIFDPDDLPWFGTIELDVGVPSGDYAGSGAAAGHLSPLDFTEGMNVRVRGLPGNPLLHVVGVELDLVKWSAVLTVDEAARNMAEIEAILSRDKATKPTTYDPTGGSIGGGYDGTYYDSGYYPGGGGNSYVGDGSYYGSPPPFVESDTEPDVPAGWGWLDTSSGGSP